MEESIERNRLYLDDCARRDDDGVEYWLAREIMKPLGYARWENFSEALKRALKITNVHKCGNSSKCGFVNLQSIKSR